ncbi:sulfatase-like hydrolase/transferase [Paenibacillus sp. FSL H8-0034]|uniref:sulfatase-like hydrolase/transferase n=1 Tax=Paenibacillus sp. FSL H8-0034 TaxID=2954671 RepID=UPI0030F5E6DF
MANVILLMSDEHNPKYCSVYGHSIVQTPNMEKLAQSGTVFSNAYCLSPLCTPSRAAFVTGKRIHEVQAYSNCKVNLDRSIPSFGKVLADQGVHTVVVGGSAQIYEEFSEQYETVNEAFESGGLPRRPGAVRKGVSKLAAEFGIKDNAFDRDLKRMEIAMAWLKEKAPGLEQPWVLVINLPKPHFPLWTTREFWDMYQEGVSLPEYGAACESAQHPYAADLRYYFETNQFTDEQILGLRQGYFGCVSFVDRQLGRIMEAMEQSDLQENTNLIYTADHGEMLGKYGLWWKSSMFEDSIRVPCIAAGPDFGTGFRVETPVDLLDVQATIFQSTGVPIPDGRRGTPLTHIPNNDSERIVFSEYHGHAVRSGAFMIRKGDWKLIYNMDAEHQLFQLSNDPHELENVYTQFPSKALELEIELRKICSPEKENIKAHEFQKKQLEDLKQMSN